MLVPQLSRREQNRLAQARWREKNRDAHRKRNRLLMRQKRSGEEREPPLEAEVRQIIRTLWRERRGQDNSVTDRPA